MSINDILSKNIKYYRKKKKLTQKELAEKLDVKNSSVSNWEQNQNMMDIDTLHRMCKVLDVSINEMLDEEVFKMELTEYEQIVLDNLNKLNEKGKEYVLDQIEYAISKDKYKKFNTSLPEQNTS